MIFKFINILIYEISNINILQSNWYKLFVKFNIKITYKYNSNFIIDEINDSNAKYYLFPVSLLLLLP